MEITSFLSGNNHQRLHLSSNLYQSHGLSQKKKQDIKHKNIIVFHLSLNSVKVNLDLLAGFFSGTS